MVGGKALPLRFGRSSRIKQGRDFARLRRQGQRLASGCLLGNWLQLEPDSPSRLGVITANSIGGAVARNRARRLLREAYRIHQHSLRGGVELVLVARASIAGKNFSEVEKDFLTMVRKARLLKQTE